MKSPRLRLLLILILAFAFFTRIWRLHLPERYIFDEVYHAVTAKLIAANDPRAYEWWNPPPEPETAVDWLHPPLAKYTQAASIRIFGATTFGWRLSSALFGVGVIYATFLLTRELLDREDVAVLAAGLASLDGLLLVQSRIAMNDIHVTLFVLLTYYFYVKRLIAPHPKQQLKWLAIAGLTAGLALGTKWSGLFALLGIGTVEAIWGVKHLFRSPISYVAICRWLGERTLLLLILPFAIYLLSYSHMFLQGKTLSHFYQLHQQIYAYQTGLKATHPYQSRPSQWFINERPVWFHVDRSQPKRLGNIYALGNPALQWLGAAFVIGTFFWMINQLLTNASKTDKEIRTLVANLSLLTWWYAILWVPWVLSPRILFYYHYTPAIPLLTIVLAIWLSQIVKIKHRRWPVGWFIVSAVITVCIATFVLWLPHWLGIPIKTELVNSIYFARTSWQ